MKRIRQWACAGALLLGAMSQAHAQVDFFSSFLKRLWITATPDSVELLVRLNPPLVYGLVLSLGAPDLSYGTALIRLATYDTPRLSPPTLAPEPGSLPVTTNAYTQMIGFGDSMSDTGNIFTVTKSIIGWGFPTVPDSKGRFCNGDVALEVMANRLNLPFVNYSFAGGTSGAGDLIPLSALQKGVLSQVSDYLYNLSRAGKTVDAKALHVIWVGPNDYYQADNVNVAATATKASANISSAVASLYAKGARNFFIPLMPDFSLTPSATAHEALAPGYKNLAAKRSDEFATALKAAIAALKTKYPAAKFNSFDTLTYTRQQIALAKTQGINVTDQCMHGDVMLGTTTSICPQQDKYLYWDSNHPTAAANLVLGAEFAKAAAQ